MIEIFDSKTLSISIRNNVVSKDNDNILLSFTGIGHAMGGIDVQNAEFFGLGRNFDNVIFITDKTRSWGNLLNFEQINIIVKQFANNSKLYSIGNSMGGCLSIIASKYIEISVSISFAPQFSVNPKIASWETRWRDYISNIKTHDIEHVGSYFNNKTRYFIFSSGDKLDRRHATLFPVKGNINHYLFPEFNHALASQLKEVGVLYEIISKALDGSINLDDIKKSYNIKTEQLSPKQ